MIKEPNLLEVGSKNLDSLKRRDLRSILDACLDQGMSFSIKKHAEKQLYNVVIIGSDSFNSTSDKLSDAVHSDKGLVYRIGSKTVAVVGPDGSGKTTLIDAIKADSISKGFRFKRFKRYFRRVLPYVFRSEDRNDRDQKLLWLILPVSMITFSIGYMLSRGSKQTLLDRYFYDYLIRDLRETDKSLSKVKNYNWWTRVLPRPAKLIVAICPPVEILKRKQEMSVAAINDLYDVYLDQIIEGRLPEVLFCNTSLDLEISCRQAIDFLADN